MPVHVEPVKCQLGSSPPATSPHLLPSVSLRSSSASPLSVRVARCGLRPSPASASRRALVSGPVHAPPPACSARPPSVPSALTATQSPWRLLSAGFSGVDSPSLVPLVLSFLTACAGSGSHTPRINDAGCAIGTFGVQPSAQPSPLGTPFLLDRTYVAPIHAVHPLPGHPRLRLSYTDTRPLHACPCRKHGPIHNRHARMMVASVPVAAFVPDPYTPRYRNLRRYPSPGIPDRAPLWPVHETRSDDIRAPDKTEIATPPPIW